jgi:hypothetical protein
MATDTKQTIREMILAVMSEYPQTAAEIAETIEVEREISYGTEEVREVLEQMHDDGDMLRYFNRDIKAIVYTNISPDAANDE